MLLNSASKDYSIGKGDHDKLHVSCSYFAPGQNTGTHEVVCTLFSSFSILHDLENQKEKITVLVFTLKSLDFFKSVYGAD